MVLETAVNGRAHAIVTFNLRHYGDAPAEFGIEVLGPAEVTEAHQMSKGATYPLRLSRSVLRAAEETAAREGVSLNLLIATALAEKLSALRTEDLLAERAVRGDWDRVRGILDRVGIEPPCEGDEPER